MAYCNVLKNKRKMSISSRNFHKQHFEVLLKLPIVKALSEENKTLRKRIHDLETLIRLMPEFRGVKQEEEDLEEIQEEEVKIIKIVSAEENVKPNIVYEVLEIDDDCEMIANIEIKKEKKDIELVQEEDCEAIELVQEEDEEEVFEMTIKGKQYYVTNEQNGIIYAKLEDEDVGDQVGVFKNGVATFTP